MTKKKINIRKIMQQNKRVLASLMVVMILFFVLAFDLGVFAETVNRESDTVEMGGDGSFESGGTTIDVYNLEKVNDRYPVINSEIMRSYYTGSGQLKTAGNQNGSTIGINPATADWNWIFEDTSSRGAFVPVSVSAGGVTQTDALGAGYYVCSYAPGTASSQQYVYNYRFSGAGKMFLICDGDYVGVVSDQPIYYIWTRSMAYFGKVVTVCNGVMDSPNANGLYLCYAGFSSYAEVFFTDMPINIASSDGASGFTGLSDYDINGDNVNFNNLLRDNVVVDPNVPAEDDSVISQAGLNYNFGYANVHFEQGSDNSTILARWNLNINEYMRLHPYDFAFCSEYKIKLQTASGVKEFSTSFEPTINDVLLHGDQNYLCNMNFNNMNDGNESLQLYLKELFGQSANSSLYTDGSVISYGVTNPNAGTRSFGGFTLGVKQYFDNIILGATFEYDGYFKFLGNPITESGHISGTYNLKTGETKVTKDDITTNFNPPADNTNGLGNYSGSSGVQYGSGSAIATISSGAIQISNTFGNLPGFQISNQDWNEYGNLVETMNKDMLSIVSDDGVSGFFGAVKNAYTVFPEKIWALIGIGIGGSIAIGLWKKGTHCH